MMVFGCRPAFGTPGYWGWNNGGFAFNNGYWGPQGFYGGVNYGYGYGGGVGFGGGRWNGGNFSYNTGLMRVNMRASPQTRAADRNVINNVNVKPRSQHGAGRAASTNGQTRPRLPWSTKALRTREYMVRSERLRQTGTGRTLHR